MLRVLPDIHLTSYNTALVAALTLQSVKAQNASIMTNTDCTLERPRKRLRSGSTGTERNTLLPTPPATDLEVDNLDTIRASLNPRETVMDTALHVLSTEAAALTKATDLYRTDPEAQAGLQDAVSAVVAAQESGNKVIVCGVGKSAFVGMKLVASCKSLGIAASFMHACEAAHGDLGDVRAGDVVLFVTYSGRTPELMNLLPHLPIETRLIALTGQRRPEDCRLLDCKHDGILLAAPVHETEETSFGVAAPTTSTVVAMAVADMLVLTVAGQLHGERQRAVFVRNHPGGAIGLSEAREVKKVRRTVTVETLELPSPEISGEDDR